MNTPLQDLDIAITATEEAIEFLDCQVIAVGRQEASLYEIVLQLENIADNEYVEEFRALWHEASNHLAAIRTRMFFYKSKLKGMKVIKERMLELTEVSEIELPKPRGN